MALELIAEFDPILAKHIEIYGNKGKGNTSYFFYETCEEFISITTERLVKYIVREVKQGKYFSTILDSTLDITHVDQLSFIVRYLSKCGLPVERFICFLSNPGHKSEELATALIGLLNKYHLDIQLCRGKSYDNASNMSGVYFGLQARIKEFNPLAVYIPCAAHSLNLVGSCTAEYCPEAALFFLLLRHIHTFFSPSTSWRISIKTKQ
jgi:hypothetical protein